MHFMNQRLAVEPRAASWDVALSQCADAAMYRAKPDGRNSYRFFTPEIQAASECSLLLGTALRHACVRS